MVGALGFLIDQHHGYNFLDTVFSQPDDQKTDQTCIESEFTSFNIFARSNIVFEAKATFYENSGACASIACTNLD